MPYRDLEKKRKHNREYMRVYLRNRYSSDPKFRRAIIKKTDEHRRKCRDALEPIMQEFRKNGCLICGEKELCCLVAHHKNPKNKKYEIARLSNSSRNVEAASKLLKVELKKCACLCHNCHSKVHAGVENLKATRP